MQPATNSAQASNFVSVRHCDAAELAPALKALLGAEPELPYSNFAPIAARPGAAQHLHRQRWLDPDRLSVMMAFDRSGAPLAALRLESRPFESDHFGIRMARIAQPVAVSEEAPRNAALQSLYAEAFRWLREGGYAHVAARASTRDPVAAWVLQSLGAVHVDTQVSWMAALTGTPHDEALPAGLTLEVHGRDSIRQVEAASWRRLAEWAGHAFDRGPLVFDLTLSRQRSTAVYSAWTARVMAGEWADAVLLVRHAGEVVAFISMQHMPDVSEAAGTVVCGRGLGATLPDYRGLFTAIQREMIRARPLGASFMENETQVATIGSINVYARLGFRFLRSTSTFHLRLDGATAA